jgi:hypothetical protein
MNSDTRLRIGIGALGVVGILYGVKVMLDLTKRKDQIAVVKWAIGTDVITDGVIIPVILLVGWILTKVFSPRARRYIQGALIAGGAVTLIALPLIHRRGKERPGQALLQQDYLGHLFVLLGLIAAVAVGAYAFRYVRDAQKLKATQAPEPAEAASAQE